ncbi:MAG: hypothetical protein NC339_07970 [Muribaculaceae bacterium]|nr:hypothetical protein [Muribaculaceae bacterium]
MPKLIKVTFPDGEEICFRFPIDTVIAVLRKIGPSRFPEITLKTGEHRFVSREIVPELKKYTKDICDGWYYINRTDTREKTLQLISINNQLNLDLKIELGEFEAVRNPIRRRGAQPQHRLIVTMHDGEVIDYESYRDVFATVIDIFGPRRVSARANIDLNRNQSLLTTTNNDGNRLKIADHLYLAMPNTARSAGTWLELIAKRLGENINVEIRPVRE